MPGIYGTTVADVQALMPEAKFYETAQAIPPGKYGVTVGQVEAWIGEVSAMVGLRLDGWQRLAGAVTVDPGDGSGAVRVDIDGAALWVMPGTDAARIAGAASTVVANAVAAYAEGARHPERAAVADTSYEHVLWTRYQTGLTALLEWWERNKPAPAAGDTASAGGHASGVFPAPVFLDQHAW